MRTFAIFSLVTALVACAHSSAIVTGQRRPAIDAALVKVYLDPPPRYEVIGLLDSYSDVGWTDQQRTDHALNALKARAASLGANGVLIEGTSEGSSAGVLVPTGGGTAVFGTNRKKAITAKAIFVSQ